MTQNMKILWFTNTPCSASEELNPNNKGGGWLSSLEKELVKKEEISLYVAFYYSKSIEPFLFGNTQYFPILRKNSGSKIERYCARLLRLENNDKREIKLLLSVIDKINPDLIHIHGTEENFGLIQKYISIPVVLSIQGILNPCTEKFYSGVPSIIANKYESWKSKLLLKSAKFKYNNFKKRCNREREILNISKYIIGRTDWDKKVTKALAPTSKYFICNEVLRSSFYDVEWRKIRFNDKIRIVTVSSDCLYKGFETIVKTAKILTLYHNLNFEWLVIGLQKKSEIVILTKNWLKINLDDYSIKLLGKKNEDEIAELLLSADIYCQVSHIENSPNSLCESLIIGVPTIASFAGGTRSLFSDTNNNMLVQDGDSYAFSGAILELVNDFSKAKELGRNSREIAIKRHDKRCIVSNLVEIYKSIIGNRVI
jgi:glycosyltransferase involved in cell wall biosynthesis